LKNQAVSAVVLVRKNALLVQFSPEKMESDIIRRMNVYYVINA
jgi:hypothetical protein